MAIGRFEGRLDAGMSTGITELEEREMAILSELARDTEAHVAFTGLRRRLNLHQQALTRTLARLSRQGLVARHEDGYRLTDQGYSALAGRTLAGGLHETATIIQALLPPQVGAEGVATSLGHRWFRGLRWFGASHGPGETTLTWMREADGTFVRVRLQGATLALESEVPPEGLDKAFATLRPVVAAISELYGLAAAEPREGASAVSAPHLPPEAAAAM